MSKDSSSSSNGDIGVFGLLGVVFVTLKLLGIAPVSAWSWWWVTAPFWGGFVLWLVIMLIILAVAVYRA